MGMVSVGVVMTMPTNLDAANDPQSQALRFGTLVQIAEDEALISGQELGVFFDSNSYQFAVYDYQAKKWLSVMSKQIQSKVELPDALNLTYILSGSLWSEIDPEDQKDFIDSDDLVNIEGDEALVSLNPQVYIMSNGEVTPFSVEFSDKNSSDIQPVIVTVDMSGSVEYKND